MSHLGTMPAGPQGTETPPPTRKHPAMKFKFKHSILTNSNPQSIVVLLCLYKEWHHSLGYKLFVSLPSGIRQICVPAFPLDPPTQSSTLLLIHMFVYRVPTMSYNYQL